MALRRMEMKQTGEELWQNNGATPTSLRVRYSRLEHRQRETPLP
jgi:hypothetical protein